MRATYEEACRRATTNQHLDPAIEVLSKVFPGLTVAQTGGFCMCIEIKAPRPEHPDAFIWVTNDGTEDEPEYIVGFYPSPDDDSTYSYRFCPDLGATAAVIVGFQMGALE